MYKRILVPLDGSKFSESALLHVKNIVQGHPGVVVELFSVQEEILPFTSVSFIESKAKEMAEQQEQIKKQAAQKMEDYLTDVARSLGQDGIKVETMILYPDPLKSIPEMILEYSETSKADLIVMSTHGRSGISRWAFGSVANRVVYHSKIPVLIVVPAQCRT